jgi:hypothetical protein
MEQEPNDTVWEADPLDAAGCLSGEINPGNDQDYESFFLSGSVQYDVDLTASKDGAIKLYKFVNNQWVRVANTSSTEVKHVSTGGGDYIVIVSSPHRKTQTYTDTLTVQ